MNHIQRRHFEAKMRLRHRALRKFLPEDFGKLPEEDRAQMLLRLAYRAWHDRKINKDEARLCGCRV